MEKVSLEDLPQQYEDRWGKLDSKTKYLVANKARRLEYLYDLVRYSADGPPESEDFREATRRFLERAQTYRNEALETPPGERLEIFLLNWHVTVLEVLVGNVLSGYVEVRRGRERTRASAPKRALREPRRAAALMKRHGYSAAEASEKLKQRFFHEREPSDRVSLRTLSGIVSDEFGRRRQRESESEDRYALFRPKRQRK